MMSSCGETRPETGSGPLDPLQGRGHHPFEHLLPHPGAQSMQEDPRYIFLVSDGRGHTVQEHVRAALYQFRNQHYELHLRPNVRTADQVRAVLDEVKGHPACIFYTLVAHETREAMESGSREYLVPIVDLLGPTLSGLHHLFNVAPTTTPGLYFRFERERILRLEAVNFAMKHDDGRRAEELIVADVVLVGVSRSSKSSTCAFLAMNGIKAANVPLIPASEPPDVLLALDPRKVIGLTISAHLLRSVRMNRADSLGIPTTDAYFDKREIAKEILYANSLMKQQGWRSIQVDHRAIEETAKEIIRTLGLKPEQYGYWL
jgi:regulator of PEP synthase PpsR (kinase-PPPase family)